MRPMRCIGCADWRRCPRIIVTARMVPLVRARSGAAHRPVPRSASTAAVAEPTFLTLDSMSCCATLGTRETLTNV